MGCTSSSQSAKLYCSKCKIFYSRSQMRSHKCPPKGRNISKSKETPQKQPNKPILCPKVLGKPSHDDSTLYKNEVRPSTNEHILIKFPINKQRTMFQWKKQTFYIYPQRISNFTPHQIQHRTFQEKLMWFRLNMQKIRIPWETGAEVIEVDRGNILLSAKQKLSSIDFHKEVKIVFSDEKVQDAGGLLRQYIHLAMKQFFSLETGIFQLCDTQQTTYRIVWDRQLLEDFSSDLFWVFGVLLGKAIFDRISINCPINHTILRQICGQPIYINDVFSFDQKLYSAWMSILECPNPETLFLNFTELKVHSNGIMEEIELIDNGMNIKVASQNKNTFISELINLYCTKSVELYINRIKEGIERVIPSRFLMVFEPHELEMIISGPQMINVKDWKNNTEYKGYSANDHVVIWFWEVVQQLSQFELKNLLHYCTGTSRVPVLGFKYLQSNRNTISQFCIQYEKYDKKNPFPKGHTCFNRLELPCYGTKKELKQRLYTIIKEEMSHFGLD